MQWAQLIGANYNPISTSRPGTIIPTLAVPAGLYQFEMGTNFSFNNHIAMPMLLRMGIDNNTELQVGFLNKYLTLGILYGGVRIIDGFENSISLTTFLPIPMDGISYIANNDSLIEYSAYLPVSYSFQNGFSISAQIAKTVFNNNKLIPIVNYSLAIGNSFDDHASWFFELNPIKMLKLIGGENQPCSVGYGLLFLSNNNTVQFDLKIGHTLQLQGPILKTILAEDYIELGVSFRRPK